jgi:hypothetical protein
MNSIEKLQLVCKVLGHDATQGRVDKLTEIVKHEIPIIYWGKVVEIIDLYCGSDILNTVKQHLSGKEL